MPEGIEHHSGLSIARRIPNAVRHFRFWPRDVASSRRYGESQEAGGDARQK